MPTLITLIKPFVFLAALSPFLWLLFRALTDRLTVNPIEDITLTTGIWALRMLVISLAITPLRRLSGWNRVIPYRRTFGLFAFFYAALHLATYFLDQGFGLEFIVADVLKRRFITVGMLAFVLMVPLAITSTKGWIRRLGKRWVTLHRLVYISGILAVVHYLWKVKISAGPPVYYAVIVGVLLGLRVFWALRKRSRKAPSAA